MADVRNAMHSCLFAYVVHHGRNIVLADLVKTVIVVFLRVRAQEPVLAAIDVATVVSEPHVKSSLNQLNCNTLLAVLNEGFGAGGEPMLKKDDGLGLSFSKP